LQRGKDVDLCPSYNNLESRKRGIKFRETTKEEYEHDKTNKNIEVVKEDDAT
jgi:hypothetical protein